MNARRMGEIFSHQLSVFEEVRKSNTHCITLSIEAMRNSSPHFVKEDMHFTVDGLRSVYGCSLDGRKYEVLIRPIKEARDAEHNNGG